VGIAARWVSPHPSLCGDTWLMLGSHGRLGGGIGLDVRQWRIANMTRPGCRLGFEMSASLRLGQTGNGLEPVPAKCVAIAMALA
jgi:hypothetical protein